MEQERIEQIEKMSNDELQSELKKVTEMISIEKAKSFISEEEPDCDFDEQCDHFLNLIKLRKESRFIGDLLKTRMA